MVSLEKGLAQGVLVAVSIERKKVAGRGQEDACVGTRRDRGFRRRALEVIFVFKYSCRSVLAILNITWLRNEGATVPGVPGVVLNRADGEVIHSDLCPTTFIYMPLPDICDVVRLTVNFGPRFWW
jgi:hypothetical protein